MGGPNSGLAYLVRDIESADDDKSRRAVDLRIRRELPRVLNTLFKLLDISDNRTRAQVAMYLADRCLGKPAQAVQVTGQDGGPIRIVEINRLPDAAGQVIEGIAVPVTEQALLGDGDIMESNNEASDSELRPDA